MSAFLADLPGPGDEEDAWLTAVAPQGNGDGAGGRDMTADVADRTASIDRLMEELNDRPGTPGRLPEDDDGGDGSGVGQLPGNPERSTEALAAATAAVPRRNLASGQVRSDVVLDVGGGPHSPIGGPGAARQSGSLGVAERGGAGGVPLGEATEEPPSRGGGRAGDDA
eukprot:185863-Chlamydomonas_euryale.AAC.2